MAADRSLLSRTIASARRDRVGGTAAELAFFLILSIPPSVLILAGLAGYMGRLFGSDVQRSMQDAIVRGLGTFLQPDTMRDFVVPAVGDLFGKGRADILSLGAILAAWSASRVTNVFMRATSVAYSAPALPGWRRRLASLAITVGGLVVLAFALPLIVAGPRIGDALAEHTALPPVFGETWRVLYWPVAIVLGVAILASIYHFASGRRRRWVAHVPGALLAAGVWVAAAFGLRVYAGAAFGKGSAFGPLGAPIILLLWLYVSAIALLIGVELNAELYRSHVPEVEGSDPEPWEG
jgi:membrane protein